MIDTKDTVTYPLSAIIDECNHDLSEQETACADGFCPICASAEIVRLTKRKDECSNGWDGALATVQRLERELADAVAKERERCARVCEEFYSVENIAQKCAETIRKGE
jgi:hypothetical protein